MSEILVESIEKWVSWCKSSDYTVMEALLEFFTYGPTLQPTLLADEKEIKLISEKKMTK